MTAHGTIMLGDQSPLKQSEKHHPVSWDLKLVQSLRNEYADERYISRSAMLKENVKMMLDQEMKVVNQLELIDNLQRLGLSYHFEDKIRSILSGIYNTIRMRNPEGLYATALEFRLLRQHGFYVPQEIFESFKDEKGDFKHSLCEDLKGLLYLYEASYLEKENESNLEMAREFTAKHLKEILKEKRIDQELEALVQHALELPLHWRMMRLEARWFIDIYEARSDRNPILLELAKLDFNIVQAIHQNDLECTQRWWSSTGLAEKLPFARDIMVENFFWTVGTISDPEHGYARRLLTKVAALVTAIDDVYDQYGTEDELELFTSVVERWDVNSIDQLPDYMKICFLALFNFVNEMAYDALKEGVNIIPYLRKAWADLCKAYLQEAKWFFSGHIPTLQQYLNNAWISISAPLVVVHAYFCVDYPINKDHVEYLEKCHKTIRCSSMIIRLANDLGTSPESEVLKSADVPKSIQCYMKETGACEEKAREYLRFLIIEAWKQMNEAQTVDSPFSSTFKGFAVNVARMGQCMYQHGDGHGHQNSEPRDRILSLLFEPISSFA
ncbi:linalool synthase TPS2, chloroplastic-like [Coffea arabica]|uniref:myrcene synthase n=1 Tax=Coffea arabica TaxID=13443 RepID=A0A6P6URM6_COFAR|nr:(-)-alpha-terpineol synthase-like [Coffea arabica]